MYTLSLRWLINCLADHEQAWQKDPIAAGAHTGVRVLVATGRPFRGLA
jgi:hypothetical protein